MSTIATLRGKLSTLAALDPNRLLFGSAQHDYQLNPVLTEEEIAQFEAKHRTQLPSEYRQFLLEMGNGGAGPVYGLTPLATWEPEHFVQVRSRLTTTDGQVFEAGTGDRPELARKADPSRPFPLKEAWALPEDDASSAKWTVDVNPYDGCTHLAEIGCGYFYFLVMTGDKSGEVWSDYTACGEKISPTGQGFFAWYETWLDASLEEVAHTFFLTSLKRRAAYEADKEPLLKRIEASCADYPDWFLGHIRCAVAHAYRGQYDDAERCLKKAEELKPNMALDVAVVRVAVLWAKSKNSPEVMNEVVTVIRAALETDDYHFSNLAELHEVLVLALRLLNQYPEALEAVNQWIEFDDSTVMIFLEKAYILCVLGDKNEAERTIRLAAEKLQLNVTEGFAALARRLNDEGHEEETAYWEKLSQASSG